MRFYRVMLGLLNQYTLLAAAQENLNRMREHMHDNAQKFIKNIQYDLQTCRPILTKISPEYPSRNIQNPPSYTHPSVIANDRTVVKNGWADPVDHSKSGFEKRLTFENNGVCLLDGLSGAPRNPRGNLGINGRGLLGKWAANMAADPIVTAKHPTLPGVIQVVVIRRKDNGLPALPGGMVDDGESVSVTLKREFQEEAGAVDPEHKEEFEKDIQELFKNGKVVYKGYVDDPRNTNNAWMETTACNFHCSDSLRLKLKLKSGSDASDVFWLNVDPTCKVFNSLYANHQDLILLAALSLI